jgi:tetraacyldisaccharide 4'-kinase
MRLDEGGESLWRTAARFTLAPASALFGAGSLLRRALYARGALRPRALPMCVVSVGSLVKESETTTLAAAWIANALHRRGHRVALAAGGAGRARQGRKAVLVVSDGRYVKSRVEIAGASAMILAGHSPGIPVLIGYDRFHVGVRASAAFGSEILVVDDGFQCHSLERDVDIVAIDGRSGFGNRWLLPCGPLLEPVRALRRASAVGVIDGPLAGRDARLLERFASGAARFAAQRRPIAVRPLRGGEAEPPEVLEGAAVGLISGLARPTSLRNIVEQIGAKVVTERNFGDHYRYGPRDVRYLYRNAPLWITTEKDAIRINPDWIGRADVRVLSIKMEVAQEGPLLDWLEANLRQPAVAAGRLNPARAVGG